MGGSQSQLHRRAGYRFDGDSRRFQQHRGQQWGAGGYRYGPNPPSTSRHRQSRYSRIESEDEVFNALAEAGLEDWNLTVGIDFTDSNERTGGRSLHHISSEQNPYEQVLSIMKETLSKVDEDSFISCFGFGDETTRDQDVFCFYPDERPCIGFSEALDRYRELSPQLRLAGPKSFVPIIEMAMTNVERSGGLYHVLLIISNGQITRSVHTAPERLSFQELNTIDAIVKASRFPLSIVVVGVGNGSWDMMNGFADKIPTRDFDNFHFVNFSEIMRKGMARSRREEAFALSVLMKIPQQYEAIRELGLLGRGYRIPLPPPTSATNDNTMRGIPAMSKNLRQSRKEAALMEPQQSNATAELPPFYDAVYDTSSNESDGGRVCLECLSLLGTSPPMASVRREPSRTAIPAEPSTHELCPICLEPPKDGFMAFYCGHRTCCGCGASLESCPICRSPITMKIKLYPLRTKA